MWEYYSIDDRKKNGRRIESFKNLKLPNFKIHKKIAPKLSTRYGFFRHDESGNGKMNAG